jgi:long-chain fatty acid transport protein
MRTQTKILLAALLLAPALAWANGYDVPNVNSRDLALSGSAVAAQTEAAATYANPASLSRLSGLNLSLSPAYLDNGTTWHAPPGSPLTPTSVDTDYQPAPPLSLFAAYGWKLFDRNAGVGIGANIPAGGNVFWPESWPGRSRIITVDRKVYAFYLTGGYEVLPRIRFGGGIVGYYTTEYLKQGIEPSQQAFVQLSTSGGMVSYDLSAEAQPLETIPLTIGIDYKHQAVQHLSGDAHFNLPPVLQAAPGAPVDQSAKHTLTYPNVLNVGLSYRVIPQVLVTFGYTFNRYVVYREDRFVGSQGLTVVVPRFYSNGWTYRLGGEWDVLKQLTLRIGGLRDISGVNAFYLSPTLPDSNVWAISGGAGWKFTPELQVNVAVFYAWFDKISVPSNSTEFLGSYDSHAFIASANVTWRTDLGMGSK